MNCFKRNKKSQLEQEFPSLQKITRFKTSELSELYKRFMRMSEGQQYLTKSQFRDNMGLLGLDSVYFLSDSLFAILDDDMDQKINYDEFVVYFDKITFGDAKEKAEISYKLIDQNRVGYFTLKDFQATMQGIIQSWVAMTGQQLIQELQEHLDQRVLFIFSQMDTNKDEKVNLWEYQNAVTLDPSLLDIFEFLKKGITETMREANIKRDQIIIDELQGVQDRLQQIFIDAKTYGREDSITNLKPAIVQSFINCLNKVKAQKQSTFGIHYLVGEDVEHISSLKLMSSNNALVTSQFDPIPLQKSDIVPAYKFQTLYTNKTRTQTDSIYEQNHNNEFIEEMTQKLKNYSESQLRELIMDILLHVHDVKKIIDGAMFRMQQYHQQKVAEFNEKYVNHQEQMRRLKQTVQNIHKRPIYNVNSNNMEHSANMERRESVQSLSVQFGHQNWNLVVNMMIGIQMAVKSVNAVEDCNISQRDFMIKYYFELLPRRAQNDKQSFKVCKFYDYAPQVFNQIRRMFKVDNDRYLSSIGPETILSSILKGDLSSLSELTSSGKSGSFFYYSSDGHFTLKTICINEFTHLQNILHNYYNHLKNNPNSLIIKFYGMHKMELDDKNIYFVIMSNVFHTEHEIHRRYDIKGSLYQRSTPNECSSTVARKDLDFLKANQPININIRKQRELLDQVDRDAQFFADNNIIDYSLLYGIHNLQYNITISQQQYEDDSGISIIKSQDGEKLYFFGIIDILTNFNVKKKMEYCCKRILQGPTISAIPPVDYCDRFRQFVHKMFISQQGSSISS